MRLAGLKLVAGNYSVAPADGTGAHLVLDCQGHTRPFTLDLSNSTLVMQVTLAIICPLFYIEVSCTTSFCRSQRGPSLHACTHFNTLQMRV